MITPRPHGKPLLIDLVGLFLWGVFSGPGFGPTAGRIAGLVAVLLLVLLNLPGFTRLGDDGVFNWRWYRWKHLGWREIDHITTDLVSVSRNRSMRVVKFGSSDRSYHFRVGRRRTASRVAASLNRVASAHGISSSVYAVDLDGSLSLSGKPIVRWPEPWPWELVWDRP